MQNGYVCFINIIDSHKPYDAAKKIKDKSSPFQKTHAIFLWHYHWSHKTERKVEKGPLVPETEILFSLLLFSSVRKQE